jgi:outer membrane protein assembly factor BamB
LSQTYVFILFLCCASVCSGGPWSHLAGDSARSSVTTDEPVSIAQSAWVLDAQLAGESISIVGQSGVVTWGNYIYALGEIAGCPHVICASKADGVIVWSAPIPEPVLDSWASPVVDATNRTLIVASGNQCLAFHARFGFPMWTTTLDLNIVNASPLVTDDLADADRMFITDYDGNYIFGGGHLYSINTDPFDATANQYQPGEIVWKIDLNAATSGNSPAYQDGVVYVADAGSPSTSGAGRIRAFDSTTTSPPAHLWQTTNPAGLGFFGGVTISNGAIFAASYSFTGTQLSANLLKLDALTGAIGWSEPCNRTSTIPVVLDDSRIALSSGLLGFGSVPSVQLFQDNTTSASFLWDSAIDSWFDANTNGQLDIGEFLSTGGWTTQALIFDAPSGAVLMAGGSETSGLFGAPETLFVLDLDAPPSSPSFVIDTYSGAGSTPAYDSGNLYTIGQNGLVCFGVVAPPPLSDMDRDLITTPEDAYLWSEGIGAGGLDVDQNQIVDLQDLIQIETDIRSNETTDIVPIP